MWSLVGNLAAIAVAVLIIVVTLDVVVLLVHGLVKSIRGEQVTCVTYEEHIPPFELLRAVPKDPA